MRRATGILLLGLTVALAGCGGSAGSAATPPKRPPKPPPARPALCGPLTFTTTGRVRGANVGELSGLVASRRQRGVFWAIEDSGNSPDLIALRADGTFLGRFGVSGAENTDWEDVAAAGPDVYVADIGDNQAARSEIVVYRVPEPDASTGGGATAPAERIAMTYPDGAHDAESLLVDPRTRELIVVTKDWLGPARVYVAPPGGGRLVDTGRKLNAEGPVTGAGLSPDGRTVAVRAYTRIYAWKRRPGERLRDALRGPACASPTLLDEGQGEAVAVLRGGRSFLTVTEGTTPPVRRYEAR